MGWLSLLLAVVALALVIGALNALWQKRQGPEILITVCPLVVGILMILAHSGMAPLTVSIIFNLYVICLAVILLWQGTMTNRVALVNGCIFTFLAMIGARFFDPAFTFVERGFTFIIVGGAIFVVNLFYMWRKQAQQAQVNASVAKATRRVRRSARGEVKPAEAGDEVVATSNKFREEHLVPSDELTVLTDEGSTATGSETATVGSVTEGTGTIPTSGSSDVSRKEGPTDAK